MDLRDNTSTLRRARLAVLAVFFTNGFGFSNWVVRIPAIQEKLSLSEGLLGLALLSIAVGGLASMSVTGWLAARFGSRPVVGATAVLFSLALILPPLASSYLSLSLVLLFFGAAAGSLDVSMNSQAVVVEKEYRRPIMTSFHAAFSIGGLAGAVTGGLLAFLGVGVAAHLSAVAILMLAAGALAYRGLLPASVDVADEGPAFARPTWALAGLGVIAFCVLLGEGAMADWSAVYLEGTLDTGPGFAAAGYAAFSLMMAAGRLAGDRLIERFGTFRVVRTAATLAATGLGTSLVVAEPLVSLVGFGAAGAGFSVIFPAALSAAGRTGEMPAGPAIAAVSTVGYFGFLAGPPAIGFIAELVGLGGALGLIVFSSAAVAVLARAVGTAGKGATK